MNSQKHILLICYGFPPYPGIGGRRWAKFAKYLSKAGFILHVIRSENNFDHTSLWADDVLDNERIKHYPLPARYPKILLKTDQFSFMNKLLYHFWKILLSISSKGNIYDRGIFWKKAMLTKATELIQKNKIQTVIATGAPFSVLYYAARLKEQNTSIQLIADLRDPWTWGKGYGYADLPEKKKVFENDMEKQVLSTFDVIFTPSNIMNAHLKQKYPSASAKIKLLPHAFDTDEIKPIPYKKSGTKKRLIFYGTMYHGLEKQMEALAKSIVDSNLNVTIDFYSDSLRYSDVFKKAKLWGEKINYLPPVAPKQLFAVFPTYDFVVLIPPDHLKDDITTKFYEIVYSQTPIIYIGRKGVESAFVEENRLGIFVPREEIATIFPKIISGSLSVEYNLKFDVEAYSFQRVTELIINEFKVLKETHTPLLQELNDRRI